jgi:NodT family efflux transporter outer membrane factor (OMF) lipoprotein
MVIENKKQINTSENKLFNSVRLGLLISIFLTMVNCSSGSRAQPLDPPTVALETAFQESEEDPLLEYQEILSDEWWELFEDEQLTTFIKKALSINPTLQASRAKIYLAKAVADTAKSSLFPFLSWGGDILREKFSETGLIPFGTTGVNTSLPSQGGLLGIPVYFTQYETELNLSYDFDVWGKNRHTLLAAVGEMQAKIADEAFLRLEMAIAVAQTYFQLQIDYKRQEYARSLVENKNKYLNLVNLRLKNHLSNEEEIQRAENNLASAKQKLLQVEKDVALQEYTLKAYLAENFEDDIYQINIVEEPLPKTPIPRDLSLNLVARRPDIASQLWIIQSNRDLIKVAKAGFYPDFSLTGLFGFQSLHPKELFKWPSSFFNIDPAFSLPLFDGGRLRANLRSSEINYDIAIYNYNELILKAAKEILTNLAVLKNANSQLQELKKMSQNQITLLNLTQQRVNHNLSSNLDYLMSQENLLISFDQEALVIGDTLQAILNLIKALGGGYGNCDGQG